MFTPPRPSPFFYIAFFVLLVCIVWAFFPGLSGTLIFDDYPNLRPWSDLGDIDSYTKILTFSLSGTGLPGRPLSLLSFLIDDQSWPPDIFALKRTNLAVHLINTCLIFWLSLTLLAHFLPQRKAQQPWLALLAAAIWALHPLQVSNVSYIIQRMNLLSTMLELIGILLFIYGRKQLALTSRKALFLCSLSIGIFMPLAILAKENGLLLCAFLLLIDAFCFKKNEHRFWHIWKALFLWLPLIAFLTYILITSKGFTIEYPQRNFNSWERLLTQGPVLVNYLYKLLIPHLLGSGLYFDNFPISRSLFNPISTLFSWLFLIGIFAFAIWKKKTMPLFAFGIFFYFIGHLMESTLIPLEIYFEHRNYLPQLGLWLALIAFVAQIPVKWKNAIVIVSLLLITLLTLMARNNAALWGNPDQQAAIWYHENPSSLRTATDYANLLLVQGHYQELNDVLARMQKDHPNKLIVPLSQRYIQCYWQGIPATFVDLAPLARHADYEIASISMLEKMHALAVGTTDTHAPTEKKGCQFATLDQIATLYTALLDNPRYSTASTRTQLFEFLAEISVKQYQLDSAMSYYDQAFSASKNPIYPYRQALLLQSAGLPKDALTFLTKSEDALSFKQRAIYPDLPSRIAKLRYLLQKEISSP